MTRKYIKNCTGGSGEKSRMISRAVFRVMFYILLVIFTGVSVYMLFFSQYLQITNIKITGNRELSEQDLKQALESNLSGKFLNIIPKNNFLFISQKSIANFFESNFKKIRSVNMTKKFPDSLAIEIDERKAILVWCSGENCFLLDENGIAYNTADFNSPEITQNHLLRINDISARNVVIGEKVIDPAYEQYVIGIKDALKVIGQQVSEDDRAYSTPSNMAYEIDVTNDKGTQIYFSTQFSLDSAINTLDVVLKKEIPQDKIDKLEYIDLRSEGRVFYKFRDENPESQNSN